MRVQNHHLKQRGKRRTWHLRYEVPSDLCLPGAPRQTMEESLKTSDVVTARKLRDRRLHELESKWHRMRAAKNTKPARATQADIETAEYALAIARKGSEAADEYVAEIGDKMYDEVDAPHDGTNEDWNRASDGYLSSPRGQYLSELRAIAERKRTPIRPVADEWLLTKNHPEKTMREYRRAIDILTAQFTHIEEVNRAAKRLFLADLLRKRALNTVQKYMIAYRGVWEHIEAPIEDWSTRGLSSSVPITRREIWTWDDYSKLIIAARRKRPLYLLIRIAAHSGASLSGIVDMELRDDGHGLGLHLPETKTEHRARTIPCHSAITEDVQAWVALQASSSRIESGPLSKRFGNLKRRLKFGPDKVFHSFRHSVTHQLENASVPLSEIQRL